MFLEGVRRRNWWTLGAMGWWWTRWWSNVGGRFARRRLDAARLSAAGWMPALQLARAGVGKRATTRDSRELMAPSVGFWHFLGAHLKGACHAATLGGSQTQCRGQCQSQCQSQCQPGLKTQPLQPCSNRWCS